MPDPTTHFAALGGTAAVERVASRFYDIMERDEPELTAVHETDKDGKIAQGTRARFASFLVFWLGGPDDYLREHGHPRLRRRHAHVPIDTAMRDAWLRCMSAAVAELDPDPQLAAFLNQAFGKVADFLRNRPG